MNGDYSWPKGQDDPYSIEDLLEYFSNGFVWEMGRADNGEWKMFLHQAGDTTNLNHFMSSLVATHGLQIICAPTNRSWSYWPEPYQEQYISYCLNELPKRVRELENKLKEYELHNAQNK